VPGDAMLPSLRMKFCSATIFRNQLLPVFEYAYANRRPSGLQAHARVELCAPKNTPVTGGSPGPTMRSPPEDGSALNVKPPNDCDAVAAAPEIDMPNCARDGHAAGNAAGHWHPPKSTVPVFSTFT